MGLPTSSSSVSACRPCRLDASTSRSRTQRSSLRSSDRFASFGRYCPRVVRDCSEVSALFASESVVRLGNISLLSFHIAVPRSLCAPGAPGGLMLASASTVSCCMFSRLSSPEAASKRCCRKVRSVCTTLVCGLTSAVALPPATRSASGLEFARWFAGRATLLMLTLRRAAAGRLPSGSAASRARRRRCPRLSCGPVALPSSSIGILDSLSISPALRSAPATSGSRCVRLGIATVEGATKSVAAVFLLTQHATVRAARWTTRGRW